MLSSDFISASVASVDCHRWRSRGDSGLKLDGWIVRLDRSNLELEAGVEMDLENVEGFKARVCFKIALRIMTRYQGVESRGRGQNGDG